MRVPDEIRDCVCFVQTHRGANARVGTGFFVGVRIGDDHVYAYAVTARHCILSPAWHGG